MPHRIDRFHLRLLFIALIAIFASQAVAQTPPRIAIADLDNNPFNYTSSHPTLAGCSGHQPGQGTCRVHKSFFCTNGACIEQFASGTASIALGGDSFHPWAAAVSAMEDAPNSEIIVLTGADTQAKSLWVEQNAVANNIVAYNLNQSLDVGSDLTATQINNLKNNLNVVIVNSAGNGGSNGFRPTGGATYTPNNLFGMNGLAEHSDTIAVGAGFSALTSQNVTLCDNYPFENDDPPELVAAQLLCSSDAPDDPDTDANYYVEFACAPGFSYNSGAACGTSFAAPRVAGIVAELRFKNPSLPFDEIITALDFRSTGCPSTSVLPSSAQGHETRKYKVPCLVDALSVVPDPQPVAQFVVVPLNGFTLIAISSGS